MKRKNYLFAVLLLGVLSTLCLADAQTDQKLLLAGQQRIEEDYQAGLADLYRRAEWYAGRFSVTERLIWLEFFSGTLTPFPHAYSLYTGTLYTEPRLSSTEDGLVVSNLVKSYQQMRNTLTLPQRKLRAAMLDNHSLHSLTAYLLDADAYEMLARIIERRGTEVPLRKEARKLLIIMDQLQWQLSDLEQQRGAALTRLKRGKERLSSSSTVQPRPQPAVEELGVVRAVSFAGDDSFCMVGGIDELLRIGDGIDNKIVVSKITPGVVEFREGCQTWKQTVGEPAPAVWGD